MKTYQDFVKWHEENYGNEYKTPSFEDVLKKLGVYNKGVWGKYYHNNCFYGFGDMDDRLYGDWQYAINYYAGMYGSFRDYGTE